MRQFMRRVFGLRAAAALLIFSCAAPASAETRVALVIGNSAYKTAGALRNPANDATDISASLKRLGFTVSTVTDADGGAMTDVLAKFADAVQGADIALFWYAGHGIQFNNMNYFLPIDAKLDNEFAFKREAFAFDDITRRMEQSAKASLIFIDACRDTPLTDKLKANLKASGRSTAIGRGLARIENQARNTLIVYATAPGEIAQDGEGRNSPFAAAMLKHMETPDVDVEVMLKDVTSDVRAATREKQRPERLSRLESKVALKPVEMRGFVVVPAGEAPQAAEKRQDEAEEAQERKQQADQEATVAATLKQQAEEEAKQAEERKRKAEEEASRQKDQAAERRRREALREAEAAEARKVKAEQEAAAAEEKSRKLNEEAAAAEERARKAQEEAGAGLGQRDKDWQTNLSRRREALERQREEWERSRQDLGEWSEQRRKFWVEGEGERERERESQPQEPQRRDRTQRQSQDFPDIERAQRQSPEELRRYLFEELRRRREERQQRRPWDSGGEQRLRGQYN